VQVKHPDFLFKAGDVLVHVENVEFMVTVLKTTYVPQPTDKFTLPVPRYVVGYPGLVYQGVGTELATALVHTMFRKATDAELILYGPEAK
jgi:hypothetical protein